MAICTIIFVFDCAGFSLQCMGFLQIWCMGLVDLQHVGSQFLAQGSNPSPLDCKADSLPLDYGNPCTIVTFIKFFYFVLGITDEQRCDSYRQTAKELSHTYTCIHFSSKPASHPSCHITLSRVPCAVQQVLVGYPFYYLFLKLFILCWGYSQLAML